MSAEFTPLIVVVEDEVPLAELIAVHLENAGLRTRVFHRAGPALEYLKSSEASLALLDINLPDISGFELLTELKASDVSIPAIFLTGNVDSPSKIKGLELGADDYITKPFSYAELLARIRAVLRRAGATQQARANSAAQAKGEEQPFEFCGAQVDPVRVDITFPSGQSERLGRKALRIVSYLNANRGRVISRRALIHAVWGVHADVTSRSLDQYIVKLRKLFVAHKQPLAGFRNVHSIGYILASTDEPASADKPVSERE